MTENAVSRSKRLFRPTNYPKNCPRLDISEVGNLEQRDVFHARQDHPELEHCNTPPTSTTISSQVQQSITTFTSGGDVSNRSHPNNEPTIEEISKKLDKVLAIVSPRVREETTSFEGRQNSEQNGPNPRYQDAKNLQEFLDVCPDIEILSISHKPGKEIKCKICDEYLHCKPGISKATASRLPTGKDAGCLSTGLKIDDSQYQCFTEGSNQKWYRFKKTLVVHLSGTDSKTHSDACVFLKEIAPTKQRGRMVVKNQLRAIINVVKSKAAALHYEDHMAELCAAGADVGDFSHSRKMFVPMIKAIDVDNRVSTFLARPLANTGLPPHYYVTADKSTNHRITNQATLICPVVNGERQAIF